MSISMQVVRRAPRRVRVLFRECIIALADRGWYLNRDQPVNTVFHTTAPMPPEHVLLSEITYFSSQLSVLILNPLPLSPDVYDRPPYPKGTGEVGLLLSMLPV